MRDGKHVILYVDDDRDFRDTVRMILESGGYEMVEADGAEQGLRVYKESSPDLLIIDLMMEEVDSGTAFVKELQALGNDKPIYMLSSAGDHLSLNTDVSSLGLSGVFQKPLEAEVLLKTLNAQLD